MFPLASTIAQQTQLISTAINRTSPLFGLLDFMLTVLNFLFTKESHDCKLKQLHYLISDLSHMKVNFLKQISPLRLLGDVSNALCFSTKKKLSGQKKIGGGTWENCDQWRDSTYKPFKLVVGELHHVLSC